MTSNTGNLADRRRHLLTVAWLARFRSATSAPADADRARSRLAKTARSLLAFLAGTGLRDARLPRFGFRLFWRCRWRCFRPSPRSAGAS